MKGGDGELPQNIIFGRLLGVPTEDGRERDISEGKDCIIQKKKVVKSTRPHCSGTWKRVQKSPTSRCLAELPQEKSNVDIQLQRNEAP